MIKGYFLCLFFCLTQFLKRNRKNYDFRGVKQVEKGYLIIGKEIISMLLNHTEPQKMTYSALFWIAPYHKI